MSSLLSFAERDSRWKNIRQQMKDRELDCLIVYGSSSLNSQTANLRYLTNILSAEGYLVFPLEGDPTLFVFISRKGRGKWKNQWVSDARTGHPNYSRAICDRLTELQMRKGSIGIVSSDQYYSGFGIPHSTYTEIVSELKEAKFVDASPLLENARLIKSAAEIACIEKAAEIGVEVMEIIRENAKPGANHKMVKLKALEAMYDSGAELGNTFLYSFGDDITHAGVKSTFLDSVASETVKENQVILTEYGVQISGYVAQYNQPFVSGRPSGQWQRVFDACLSGYERGFKALRPGLTAGELEDAVMSPILGAGYTFENPPFHGLGLSLEQPIGTFPAQPMYKPNRSFVFRENMVIELEPAAMTGDFKVGMSLGDTLLVTSSGCRRLGKESKPEFISI